MSFFVIDDRFWQHRKVQRLRASPYYAQAVAVWSLAGSWCCGDVQSRVAGDVPTYVIAGFLVPDWELAVKALVEVGLWEQTEDPEVVVFHDWEYWSGPDARAKRLERRLEDDRLRQQKRRSQRSAALEAMSEGGWSRDQSMDTSSDNVGRVQDVHVTGGKVEVVGVSSSVGSTSSRPRRRDANAGREDAMRLCVHLADRIEGNGSKRPSITVRWVDSARLLMDTDGRTEEQIHKAIDWCQDDEFWRSNIMSMPTLRAKYDQLRLKAQAQARDGAGSRAAPRPDGSLDADAILGRDLWQLPPPPDGVRAGTQEYRDWARATRAAHNEQRQQQARQAIERRPE